MFKDGNYLDFFVLFSLPPNPFCSLLSFKCLTTAITLASSLFFLAAKPLLQLALLQMFNDGDYLGFFVLFFLPLNPYCSGLQM
jgi:hypothetical protein